MDLHRLSIVPSTSHLDEVSLITPCLLSCLEQLLRGLGHVGVMDPGVVELHRVRHLLHLSPGLRSAALDVAPTAGLFFGGRASLVEASHGEASFLDQLAHADRRLRLRRASRRFGDLVLGSWILAAAGTRKLAAVDRDVELAPGAGTAYALRRRQLDVAHGSGALWLLGSRGVRHQGGVHAHAGGAGVQVGGGGGATAREQRRREHRGAGHGRGRGVDRGATTRRWEREEDGSREAGRRAGSDGSGIRETRRARK